MYYAGDVARQRALDQMGDESTRVDRVRPSSTGEDQTHVLN